jgi:anti-anti-sigma regulatory factor
VTKYQHFQIEWVDDISVLRLTDAKLMETLLVSELDNELKLFQEAEKPSKVVVNFQAVTIGGSSAIRAMIRLRERLLRKQGKLKLAAMNQVVREGYEIAKLIPTMFAAYDQPWDAIEAFRNE